MSVGKGTGARQDSGADADARDDAVFKALANATRRRILDLLRAEPMTTGAVAEAFPDLDRTTVLQHIRVLERAEPLTGRRVGKTRVLALAPAADQAHPRSLDRRLRTGGGRHARDARRRGDRAAR